MKQKKEAQENVRTTLWRWRKDLLDPGVGNVGGQRSSQHAAGHTDHNCHTPVTRFIFDLVPQPFGLCLSPSIGLHRIPVLILPDIRLI
jgi:hypothetical protein